MSKRVKQVDKMSHGCLMAILEAFLVTSDSIPYSIDKELRQLTGFSKGDMERRLNISKKRQSQKLRLADLEHRVSRLEDSMKDFLPKTVTIAKNPDAYTIPHPFTFDNIKLDKSNTSIIEIDDVV